MSRFSFFKFYLFWVTPFYFLASLFRAFTSESLSPLCVTSASVYNAPLWISEFSFLFREKVKPKSIFFQVWPSTTNRSDCIGFRKARCILWSTPSVSTVKPRIGKWPCPTRVPSERWPSFKTIFTSLSWFQDALQGCKCFPHFLIMI